MEIRPKHLFVISFDGLSSLDFEYIRSLPNFKDYLKEASYSKKVYSIYPTLTYPAHATIVTGKYPKNHGIIHNTKLQINRISPDWYWERKYIKGETFYDLAIKKGMKVASLLWPVTAKSKIQYNLPEIFPNKPWQNQIMVSLLNGNPLYQYKLNKLFGYLRKGLKQPYLDNFTHQSLLYTVKNIRTEITLAHYTDLDTQRHHYGFYSKEAYEALDRHDKRLGEFIKVLKEKNIYQDSAIILLGDHSSLDENKIIKINVLLQENGYININKNRKITDYLAISKSCGGSTYIYTKNKDKVLVEKLYSLFNELNQQYNCLEWIYNGEESKRLGADPNCTLMLEANKGYYFLDDLEGELIKELSINEIGKVAHMTYSTHGYSPFKEDYTTVFMAKGKGIKKNEIINQMNLIDEGPTIAKLLGLELIETDGKVIADFLD